MDAAIAATPDLFDELKEFFGVLAGDMRFARHAERQWEEAMIASITGHDDQKQRTGDSTV